MSGQDRCVLGIVSRGARPSYRVFCRIGIGDAVFRELIEEVDGHVCLAPTLTAGVIRIRVSSEGYSPVGLAGRQRTFCWRLGCDADRHAVAVVEVPWKITGGVLLLRAPDEVLEVFRALHWPFGKEAT